ncbi:MAG: ATP-binding cassette domain-containing protein, partial [Bacteroidaceae bacterium]|nr:ATP-binding cassette domain-containing protein [Bacteroidaceae bacterium]
NGLTKVFPPNIQALSDIYLDIAEGEFVYLIGTTGSGKTTLMRLLTREVLPTRGQVIIAGQDLRRISSSSLPYYRRNIGVVFQDYKLLPYLSAWENRNTPCIPQEKTGRAERRKDDIPRLCSSSI